MKGLSGQVIDRLGRHEIQMIRHTARFIAELKQRKDEMLKYAMLAGAMMISAPAFAQVATTDQAAPQTSNQSTQDQTVGTASSAPASTQATPDAAASAGAAAAQPASGDAVAQAVDQQFASYDKDGNGTLSKTEFGDWMVALKSQSDPTTKADNATTKQWVGAAFAQADKNKSQTLTKTEVVGFLAAASKG
jgi:hypothetical protein